MNIVHGNIAPLGVVVLLPGENIGQGIGGHADTVVRDEDADVGILLPAGDYDGAGLAVRFQDPVQD